MTRLFAAVRAIHLGAELRFAQVPDNEDMWVIRVVVGSVVVVETGGGLPDVVIHEAVKKLESLSQRIMLAVRDQSDPG